MTEEEASFYMSGSDSFNEADFFSSGWPIVKPAFEPKPDIEAAEEGQSEGKQVQRMMFELKPDFQARGLIICVNCIFATLHYAKFEFYVIAGTSMVGLCVRRNGGGWSKIL